MRGIAKKIKLNTYISKMYTLQETCLDMLSAMTKYADRKRLEYEQEKINKTRNSWNPFTRHKQNKMGIFKRKTRSNIMNIDRLNSIKDIGYDLDENDYCVIFLTKIKIQNEEKKLEIKLTPTLINGESSLIIIVKDTTY